MERVSMRFEVLKGEILSKLNEHFRMKVQLKEQLDENEVQIHFHRGMLFAINKAQEVIKEIQQAEQIESMEEVEKQKSLLGREVGNKVRSYA